MKVIFPLGGRWRMCRWHIDNDGHHLILARTHAAVVVTLKSVLVANPFAEVRGYFDIEVLAPSPLIVAMHNAILAETERRQFWDYLTWKSTEHHDTTGEYPAGVVACPGFEPHEDRYDVDALTAEFVPDPKHYGCKHCRDGLTFVMSDPDAFYQERRTMFEATRHRSQSRIDDDKRKGAVTSRAKPAGDGQPLLVAIADFGHHSKGAHLIPFEMPESAEEYLPPGFRDVLFFYNLIETLPAQDLEEMAMASEQAIRLERKASAERYNRHDAELEIADRLEFAAILKGPQ